MPTWKPPLMEVLRTAWSVLEPVIPGVLGALVAQAIRPGLGLRARLIQWTVSVIVFLFVSRALASVFHWSNAIGDVVGFFVALMAFEALHAWQKAAVEAGVGVIGDTRAVWRQLLEGWAARAGARKAGEQAPKEGE